MEIFYSNQMKWGNPYVIKLNIRSGFVRDKDTRLFINNTVYTDDMSSEYWHRLEDEI